MKTEAPKNSSANRKCVKLDSKEAGRIDFSELPCSSKSVREPTSNEDAEEVELDIEGSKKKTRASKLAN